MTSHDEHEITARGPRPGETVDAAEVARFAALASQWWDPDGKFRALHRLGPARLTFIRDEIARHFGRPPAACARSPASDCSTSAAAAGSCASRSRAWAPR